MSNPSPLKSAALLEQMKLHLASGAGKDLTKKIGLVYQLNIAPKKIGVDEEIYIIDLKKGEVTKGKYEGKPDATFSFKDSDFVAVATGKMNPQMAFIRWYLVVWVLMNLEFCNLERFYIYIYIYTHVVFLID
eukprot:TRINITY_DN3686_c0_g1_i3.p1 TRINITY_DN3686_c0_g1~~TRINITY_DN3686_c0_g1_i3.p1  ORF type:complete len:132 (-),score=22.34 TRINITY_DN3686_c0_g1_i3:396-791(-)